MSFRPKAVALAHRCVSEKSPGRGHSSLWACKYIDRAKRDVELGTYLGTNCPQVEMKGATGKKRKVLAGNTRDVLRLIQSIPSKKAEAFKMWLAQVGSERLDEIADPEKAIIRIVVPANNILVDV